VVWSKPETPCNLSLGQQLVLTPISVASGFSIPRNALFELDNRDFVAVKNGNQLQLVAVNIIGKDNLNYVVQSHQLTHQSEDLVSSVSIAQGIFMGLGG